VARRLLAWLLLLVWSAWLASLQGALASRAGAFVPELGLLLVVGLGARLSARELQGAAVVVALGRLSVGVDPVPAVLAGLLAVAAVESFLRRSFDLGGPLARGATAGVYALGLGLWLQAVNALRGGGDAVELGAAALHPAAALLLALATAVGAPLLAPVLGRLPGLALLRDERARMLGRR